jgi:uncharacterized membrane protein
MPTLKRYSPLLLSALGAFASASVYSRLPDSMAVHWDLDGNPNGWMPRPIGAFFSPVFILVLGQIMRLVPRIDPRLRDNPETSGAYDTIVASALLLVLACHGIVLGAALGYSVPVGRVVPALVGAVFVVMGNACRDCGRTGGTASARHGRSPTIASGRVHTVSPAYP